MQSRPCKFFAQSGNCRDGANCRFSHDGAGGQNFQRGNNNFGGQKRGMDGERWQHNQDQFQPQAKRQQGRNPNHGGGFNNNGGHQGGGFHNNQNNQGGRQQGGRPHNNNNFQGQQQNFQGQQGGFNQQPGYNQQGGFQKGKPKFLKSNIDDLRPLQQGTDQLFRKFLNPFKVNGVDMLAIASLKSVQIYPMGTTENGLINFIQPICVPFSDIEIQGAWLQQYGQHIILILSFIKPNSVLNHLMVIPNLDNHNVRFLINDVSDGLIQGCYLDTGNGQLYAFCHDKQIRQFHMNNGQFALNTAFQLPQILECFLHVEGTANTFLFGGQNGMFGVLENGAPQMLNLGLESKNVIQIAIDKKNQRFFILVWGQNYSSEIWILTGQGQLQGKAYEFKKQLTGMIITENLMGKTTLLVSNLFGTLVSLYEKDQNEISQQKSAMITEGNTGQVQMFQKYNQIPKQPLQQGQMPPKVAIIQHMIVYDTRNQNNVSMKFLFLGRCQQSPDNIEIYQFTSG